MPEKETATHSFTAVNEFKSQAQAVIQIKETLLTVYVKRATSVFTTIVLFSDIHEIGVIYQGAYGANFVIYTKSGGKKKPVILIQGIATKDAMILDKMILDLSKLL